MAFTGAAGGVVGSPLGAELGAPWGGCGSPGKPMATGVAAPSVVAGAMAAM
jgi:hypothetical protein